MDVLQKRQETVKLFLVGFFFFSFLELSSLPSCFFKACFGVFLVLEAQAAFVMGLVGDA